jgi:phosphatidylserine/phosphatidylglycerophosphate/cardiolipin synthase-like enzyme
MNLIDISHNRVPGGYFLLAGVRSVPFKSAIRSETSEQVLVTYRDSGAPIRDCLLHMLRSAKRRVFVASFMLGDEEVIREMIAAANRLKGGIYLITALDERSLGRGLREYEENEQESPEERRKNFERLTTAGVYVRGHESCHAKFAVVDDSVALVGSANFVANGFEWTGEANVFLRDADQIRQLNRLFSELWYEGCRWEIPPGITYLVAERSAGSSPTHPAAPNFCPGEVV